MKKRVLSTLVAATLAFGLMTGAVSVATPAMAKAKRITISSKKLTLKVGEKKTIKLKNVTKKQAKKITWKTSKKAVATVTKKGVITAKKAGKATVSATYKKKKYNCVVTVKKAAETEVEAGLANPFLDSKNDKVRCHYSDAFFTSSSTKFNHELAKCSLATAILSEAVLRPKAEGGDESELERLTESFGFDGFDVNDAYKVAPTEDSVGVACAKRTVGDRTVVAVLIRSVGYQLEWASNMTVGDGSEIKNHLGFEMARRKVSTFISEYMKKMQIQGEVTFWLAGQSRGAAIANLTAAWLAEGEQVTGIPTSGDKIYAYCFATPQAAYVGTGADKKDIEIGYGFIHNILFDRDIVSRIPPSKLGFGVYGTREKNVIGTDDKEVEKLLKVFTDTKPGEEFKNAGKQDLGGKTPAQLVDATVEEFTEMVVDRETYTKEWQDTCITLMATMFGGGSPSGTKADPEKTIRLGALFLGGGSTLLVEHYPQVEYAYLATA